jgi:hypothetical protein
VREECGRENFWGLEFGGRGLKACGSCGGNGQMCHEVEKGLDSLKTLEKISTSCRLRLVKS